MVDITHGRREGRCPKSLFLLVPGEGVEPTRYLYHRILSLKTPLDETTTYTQTP